MNSNQRVINVAHSFKNCWNSSKSPIPFGCWVSELRNWPCFEPSAPPLVPSPARTWFGLSDDRNEVGAPVPLKNLRRSHWEKRGIHVGKKKPAISLPWAIKMVMLRVIYIDEYRWLFAAIIWLVVWSVFPFSWECHHPNWRTTIFFRGVVVFNHQPGYIYIYTYICQPYIYTIYYILYIYI